MTLRVFRAVTPGEWSQAHCLGPHTQGCSVSVVGRPLAHAHARRDVLAPSQTAGSTAAVTHTHPQPHAHTRACAARGPPSSSTRQPALLFPVQMSSQETLTSACSPAQRPQQPSVASSQRPGEGPGEADPTVTPAQAWLCCRGSKSGRGCSHLSPGPQAFSRRPAKASHHDLLAGGEEEPLWEVACPSLGSACVSVRWCV